ncbi:MAG: hypothetical protein R2724_19830 [Bryobacterales bacterium]
MLGSGGCSSTPSRTRRGRCRPSPSTEPASDRRRRRCWTASRQAGRRTCAAPLRLVVGGVDALVLYPGLSGLPHLYQVNATLDASTPLGCEVPVQVIIDGVESNTVTMAVTRNGEPCQ